MLQKASFKLLTEVHGEPGQMIKVHCNELQPDYA